MGFRVVSASQVLTGSFPGVYQVLNAIKSPNYVAGSTGWAIKGDGSAEFNAVIIRGATQQQSTVLIYNGTPAAGNLILSIAPGGGTDAYGNTYPQGLAGFGNLGTISNIGLLNRKYIQIQCDTISQNIDFSPDLNVFNSGSLSSVSGNGHLTLTAPQRVADTGNGVVVDLAPANPAGAGNATLTITADVIRTTGPIKTTQPGTSTLETWHAIPLTNSWSNAGSTWPTAQYRLLASPPNTVEVIGRVSHAAVSGTSQLATTLGTGYIPNRAQDRGCEVFGNSGSPNASPVLTLDSAGVLTFFDLPVSVTSAAFHCFYPLDA